ncbi:TonB-dependent receptor [Undibacterium sp. RTI2.1]|uniref:TonB-dependent receptor domain-containing protein n=1 Tax=unclassified Undibacterium TaxID=2630295 RepID=UPI002B23ADE8|nr:MULTISPECIES: TonB-dependent receptor [unclassified Undibacterium]MEB0032846.1 TonB-dependent receptor [Undibacterium sp. RTI2.1]MEB0118927.1 TonB-dependent receptor [Undibacterium sp. RTI2.2]
MIKEKILSRSVRMIFSGGVAMSLGLLAQPAFSQEDAAPQRVEITGSSIKRIAVEGALPVQTLSKAQIEQSGATTVADLVASLPSMQGFLTSSASINGGGGGVQTASIHAIGTSYTLVLLDGHRVAPYGTGSAVNLASIPLSAVERVEILTDGASALYGSDAIAGVVNFILKKNQQDANIELTYNTPDASAKGATSSIAISKGFGDVEKDGYNVLFAYSHDEQTQLDASDRAFSANGGVQKFVNGGKVYSLYQTSSNSIPANVTVKGTGFSKAFNPALVNTGVCPSGNTFVSGVTCRFNFASTVEALPQLKRDGFLAKGSFKINQDTSVYAEALYSKFTSTAAFAPPAQPLGVDTNSKLYQQEIVPALIKLGIDPTKVKSATMNLRLVDAGRRTDGWDTEAKHVVVGLEGNAKGVDYNLSYTHSENKATDNAVAGYTSGDQFAALFASGVYNPFVAPTAATKAALAPAVLHQVLDQTVSKIDVASARGSMELFKAPGGMAQLGFGGDFSKQSYADSPSPIAQGPNVLQPNWTDTNIGGGTGALPFDSSRNSWGTFGELLVPVIKNLDVTAAIRYDSYDAVKNNKNFDVNGNLAAPATQGNTASSSTYKLAVAYRPVDELLLRGSYGTGFKAPTLAAITSPLTNGGSSNFHPCPITSGPLLPLCNGTAEYGLLSGGNALTGASGLRPEKSTQYTVGFRVEPIKSLSIGFDLWDMKLKDQIATLPESLVFDNPQTYAALFSSYYDPIQKQNVLVAALTPFNIAASHYQGIDWDHTFTTSTTFGKVALNWTGTYMLKADQDVPGSGTDHGVGRFNSYNDVVFRVISKLTATWKPSEKFLHSFTANYHSGYHDAPITADNAAVRAVNVDGTLGAYVDSVRDVKSYTVFDWQTKAKLTKNFTLTGGIKNLFNVDPPFSQRINGGGNQLGYDGRYTDPLGRQFYLVGNYKF